MFKLVRASFNQRRKTLQNGLNNSPDIPYTKEQIVEAIESLQVSPSVRGEALTLEQFARAVQLFYRKCIKQEYYSWISENLYISRKEG